MRQYYFSAFVTTEQCLGYYRGEIKNVVVTADSGVRVQLPFRHFQPFIDVNGIRGQFRLTLNAEGAFVSLEKIN
ncbi:MAG TPA: DUF2835 family protein [Rheinheimera sp.]|nr:DUF2835 family protein [Rheinheimera sp.]